MADALEVFCVGVVVGFGLSVFCSFVGTTLGRTLAIFDA